MTETGYIYQHRPSARFVDLYEEAYPFDGNICMRFVHKFHSSALLPSKEAAENMLKNAIDDNGDLYGRDNFLEFELREVKLTMTFLT